MCTILVWKLNTGSKKHIVGGSTHEEDKRPNKNQMLRAIIGLTNHKSRPRKRFVKLVVGPQARIDVHIHEIRE